MRGPKTEQTERARLLRQGQTSAERLLWSKLRNRGCAGHKFTRQEHIGPYFADFCCRSAKLVVEVDGATHSTDAELDYDKRRTAVLQSEGYRVLRFYNAEIFNNLAGVLDTILFHLSSQP
jgi:very-short-patch-repair endonuclease